MPPKKAKTKIKPTPSAPQAVNAAIPAPAVDEPPLASGAQDAPQPAPSPAASRARTFWLWFVLILAVALAVRLFNGGFVLTDNHPMLDPTIMGRSVDMFDNHAQATEILENHGVPKEFFKHSPLYLYFIATIYWFVHGRIIIVYWVQLMIGALLCPMLYGAGRRLFSERAARLAGLVAACYAPLIHNDLIFQSDALAPTMVVGLLWLAACYDGTRRPLTLAAGIGVALGLCAGERTNMALLGPALALWLVWVPRQYPLRTRLASIAIIAVISMALIAPFCVHNTRVMGKLTLTQGYLNSTWGHCMGTESTGYFNYPEGCPNNPLWPLFSLGFLKLELAKLRYLFSWFEFPDLYNYYIIGRLSPLIRDNPLTFRVVGPLGMLGMLLLWRRFKALALPYLFSLVIVAGILVFYVSSRFRAPLMPIMILFGAEAVFITWEGIRRFDSRTMGICLGGLFFLGIFVNSLDTSRFHSLWYSDTMACTGYEIEIELAIKERRMNEAIALVQRLFGFRGANIHLEAYTYMAEIFKRLGRPMEFDYWAERAKRLHDAIEVQPIMDYHGNKFFPPTDSFEDYDAFKELQPPDDVLGYSKSVFTPKGGRRQ